MSLVNIANYQKKCKFTALLILLMICFSLSVHTQERDEGEDRTQVLRDAALSLRDIWIHPEYSFGNIVPEYPLPGRQGSFIPSIEDMMLILSSMEPMENKKILLWGAYSGYIGMVLNSADIPSYIIERGEYERSFIQNYVEQNPGAAISIAADYDLSAFTDQAPFDIIVICHAVREIPGALVNQISRNEGRILVPLTDVSGSQLFIEFGRYGTGFSARVIGRTVLSSTVN